MTDDRHTSDSARPAGSDKAATSPAGKDGHSITDSLFDGQLEKSYQAMIAAGNGGGTAGGDSARDASRQLQHKGVIGKLTVVEHGQPGTGASAAEAAPVRDATVVSDAGQKERLSYLQATVGNFLPLVMAPDKGPADSALTASIARRQESIRQEAQRGEFGPETKLAYQQYVQWLEKKALPATARDLQYFNLPADDPSGKGPKAPGKELNINTGVIPDDSQLQRIDDAVKWAQAADARVQVAQQEVLKKVDTEFVDTVKRLHLPPGWIEDMERDHNRWRSSVGMLTDRTLTARSNIEILDELRRAGGGDLLSGVLPSTTSVTRDKNGKISAVHLDLPQTWDLTKPENKGRAEQLQALVAETNALLRPVTPQLQDVASHPERALSWGDTEMKGTRGLFSSSGEFLGLIPKDAPVPAGQRAEDVNLLQSRFSIEEKNNKIIVHQEVQAQSVPWWGYQNMIGVSDVGNKIDITRTYYPTDTVVVRTDSGYEVKQARDLGSYKNWQMGKYYGEKALMTALDVGMVVSGTIEVGAAVKAARMSGLGLTGLEVLGRSGAQKAFTAEGLELSSRMLAGQAGKGLLRTTVGGAGLLNNAGSRESSFGQNVNTARSVYFLADASIGLGATGWRATRSLLGGESAINAGKSSIAGLTAGSRADNFYKLSHGLFKVSEYGFIPLAASDLNHAIGNVQNDRSTHVFRAAEIFMHDQARPEQK
ncbi:MAG: hypothetical protein JSS86_09615 [Cyanobacteria bacterium SZAS LIN-2]|nr:hypothetical protein [Cyanobacteria bacterium SZAS LIN-2]